MIGIVRLAHRLLRVHRFEVCTLVDLAGHTFRGRCCRCGFIDETAWAIDTGTPIDVPPWVPRGAA